MKTDKFIFESYNFNYDTGELSLRYKFDEKHKYFETIQFKIPDSFNKEQNAKLIDSICFYIFIVSGSSYYKSFLSKEIEVQTGALDEWQADFFNMIYKGGLSQYVYENGLNPNELSRFHASTNTQPKTDINHYDGDGILLMQSGGKDSLLSAELLKSNDLDFVSWHMSSSGEYPSVIGMVGKEVITGKRSIDLESIKKDISEGGLNGHIPFSAIYAGLGLLQAVLLGKSMVIASNESSADEANITIDGYSINHQFTKTFKVELSIQEYIHRYISKDINYGSLLRGLNELQVGRLFSKYAWPKYKNDFSSCNVANYKQGEDSKKDLQWDGKCPKCANAFLLFAPFVDKNELLNIFNGKNLLKDNELTETFKQLMGLSNIKPFECVGTFDEMQEAYNLAVEKDSEYENANLPTTPYKSESNLNEIQNMQPFISELIDFDNL